ncbi:MAG: efflux RND transporter periplasmic adaptor subunit [Synechococcaceae cyanobacterium]|nr:efflux RND transporter periplasmic adaptor subunit [Synechococcaceae cyanobacterium]
MSSLLRLSWLLLVVAVPLAGCESMGRRPGARPATQADPASRPLPYRIAALGRVEPLDGVVKLAVPASLANDAVRELLVREGQQVSRGQPLVILASQDSLDKTVRQAESAVLVAERKLQAQDSAIARSRAQLQQADVEVRRYSELYTAGAASAELRDRRLTIQSTTRANLDQAIADRGTLVAELAQKRADLARDRSELDKATIRAPFGGTVFKIHAHPGDRVGDDGILDIGDSSRMGVIAEVYQSDRPGIALGQRAVISADGFPGRSMSGRVVEISRQVSRQTVFSGEAGENLDRRVIEVRIGLGPEATAVASTINYLQVNVLFDPLSAEQKRQQEQRRRELLEAVPHGGGRP